MDELEQAEANNDYRAYRMQQARLESLKLSKKHINSLVEKREAPKRKERQRREEQSFEETLTLLDFETAQQLAAKRRNYRKRLEDWEDQRKRYEAEESKEKARRAGIASGKSRRKKMLWSRVEKLWRDELKDTPPQQRATAISERLGKNQTTIRYIVRELQLADKNGNEQK